MHLEDTGTRFTDRLSSTELSSNVTKVVDLLTRHTSMNVVDGNVLWLTFCQLFFSYTRRILEGITQTCFTNVCSLYCNADDDECMEVCEHNSCCSPTPTIKVTDTQSPPFNQTVHFNSFHALLYTLANLNGWNSQ